LLIIKISLTQYTGDGIRNNYPCQIRTPQGLRVPGVLPLPRGIIVPSLTVRVSCPCPLSVLVSRARASACVSDPTVCHLDFSFWHLSFDIWHLSSCSCSWSVSVMIRIEDRGRQTALEDRVRARVRYQLSVICYLTFRLRPLTSNSTYAAASSTCNALLIAYCLLLTIISQPQP
jgi:hypothetical protein